MEICLVRRRKPYLEGAYDSDVEAIKKIKPGVIKKVKITEPRNSEHHKKLFAILNETLRTIPENSVWSGKTSYSLLKAIMFDLGHVDYHQNLDGSVRIEVQSIAFDKMDQLAFQEVYEDVIEICARLLGCTKEELNDRGKDLQL